MARSTRRSKPARHRRRIRALSFWLAGAIALVILALVRVLPHRPAPTAPLPFPCLPREALALHVHPYLQITIDRQSVPIPAGIGIRNPRLDGGIAVAGSCFEPIHTHDASGIIHIEAPDRNTRYTLRDFFAVWRATYPTVTIGTMAFPVTYTADELLGHRADATHLVRLTVDGEYVSLGSPLVLNELNFCSTQNLVPPCFPTASADPFPPAILKQYGTGHTIELEYR